VSDANGNANAKAKDGKAKRGDVVHFVSRDAQTGEQFDGLGVVTLAPDSGHLVLRPLAEYDVRVDPADVEPVIVDEA